MLPFHRDEYKLPSAGLSGVLWSGRTNMQASPAAQQPAGATATSVEQAFADALAREAPPLPCNGGVPSTSAWQPFPSASSAAPAPSWQPFPSRPDAQPAASTRTQPAPENGSTWKPPESPAIIRGPRSHGAEAVRAAVDEWDKSFPHQEAVSVGAPLPGHHGLTDVAARPETALRVSVVSKLAYAMPEFSKLSVTMLMNVHAIAFFNEFGASLAVISFFIALARSFDVLTDPLMGWFSDATRSRFGRRRIYMAGFAPLYATGLILLFSVVSVFRDSADESARAVGIAAWFGTFYTIFYLFDTGANVPHAALGPELTDVQAERNSIFFVAALFKMSGILFAAIFPVYVQYSLSVGTFDCYAPQQAESHAWPACTLLAKGLGLQYTSVALGLWYLMAISVACCVLQERPASTVAPTPPLVPSLMATFRNKPFMTLLPAWVLDQLSVTMVATMLVYFFTYIVQPHMTLECAPECTLDESGAAWYEAEADTDERGRSRKSIVFPGCRSTFWCGTSGWIGLSIVVLILGAVLSQPFWLWLTTRMDKRSVWLLYNVVNAMTNIAFILVDRGNPTLCVLFVFFNGLPLGAQFLTDSIVADVIDYDEFQTGVRSEGRFTIGQSLLPKIVSVPAATIPLTILVFLGFVPPDERGTPQAQTPRVEVFIKVVFFGIPFVCCVVSVLLKTRFPLRTETMRRQVKEGCALHAQGLPAVDPITERVVHRVEFNDAERKEQWRLDHFFLGQLEQLFMRGPKPLIRRMRINRMASAVSLVVCVTLATTGLGLNWIARQDLQWICTFSAMGGGLSLCFLLLAEARLRAALSLQYRPVNKVRPRAGAVRARQGLSAPGPAAPRGSGAGLPRAPHQPVPGRVARAPARWDHVGPRAGRARPLEGHGNGPGKDCSAAVRRAPAPRGPHGPRGAVTGGRGPPRRQRRGGRRPLGRARVLVQCGCAQKGGAQHEHRG